MNNREAYFDTVSDLEFVYPEYISYDILTSKRLKDLDPFEIDYMNNKLDDDAVRSMFGPSDDGSQCTRCYSPVCQGHFGVVKFPKTDTGKRVMIYDPTKMDEIRKLLKIVCSLCGRLIIDQNDIKMKKALDGIKSMKKSARLGELVKLLGGSDAKYIQCTKNSTSEGKNRVCPIAFSLIEKSKEKQGQISMVGRPITEFAGERKKKKEATEEITVTKQTREVYHMLVNISHNDEEEAIMTEKYIGITREELKGFFKTYFLVMPIKFRPRNGKKKNCPITMAIGNIIKHCASYSMEKSNNFETILYSLYQKYISVFKETINGKTGTPRGFIMGKRPEYGVRSVIAPARGLSINEFGITETQAKEGIIKQELVTAENIDFLQDLMYNGKIRNIKKLIGANRDKIVEVSDDNISDRSTHYLEIGDIVWRHGRAGDMITACRQPMNYQLNIIGARAVIVKGNAQILNLNATGPMRADYDGDTIAVNRPQTEEANDDVRRMIMGMNIRSSIRCAPWFGLTYNAPLALSLLTFLPEDEISEHVYNYCIASYPLATRLKTLAERLEKNGVPTHKKVNGKLVRIRTARELFSSLLPEDFYYEMDDVLIRNGVLVKGMLTVSHTGGGSGSIIDHMSIIYSGCGKLVCEDCKEGKCTEGWKITSDFIDDATNMCDTYIDMKGFSVKYDDFLFAEAKGINKLMSKRLDQAKIEILSLKRPKTEDDKRRYEKKVRGILNGLRSLDKDTFSAGKTGENSLIFMSKLVSGAKGSEGNLTSISITQGQQLWTGNRLPKTVSGSSRMIVTQRSDSLLPESEGYIYNSFVSGMTPNETYALTVSVREGMISTQTITKTIGTMQRNITAALTDIKTKRGAAIYRDKVMLDPSYGGDSMDGTQLMKVNELYQCCDLKSYAKLLSSIES
jgi:DNA-directed RNA polymerase II subunit RPB1